MSEILKILSAPLKEMPLNIGQAILVAFFTIIIWLVIKQIAKSHAIVKRGKKKFTLCDLLAKKSKELFKRQGRIKINGHVIQNKQQLGVCAELQTMEHRDKAIKWCFWIFSVTLICTFAIYLLEGFHFKGFSLPNELLTGLEYSTVGQIAGLVMVIFKFVFR